MLPSEARKQFLAETLFSPLNGMVFSQWLRFLYRYGGEIQPVYLPRTLFGTGMALMNSGVSFFEGMYYDRRIRTAEVQEPVFVLGHHRSGTTHLWNLLSQDPKFAYPSILQAVFPNSFLLFENIVRGVAQRFTMRTRPQDNVEMGPDAPIEEERALCTLTFLSMQMARHFPREWKRFTPYLTLQPVDEPERERWRQAFLRFAKKLMVRHGSSKRLLFKSPDHTGKIRLIQQVFPDAKFIYIHRDPWQVFASTQKMEEKTAGIYAFQEWKSAVDRDAFILWRYRAMYDAYIEQSAHLSPDQLVEVGFRELDSDPVGTLEQIYDQLRLSLCDATRAALSAYRARIAGYQKNDYPRLSTEVQHRVVDAWAPCFRRWGYPLEPVRRG